MILIFALLFLNYCDSFTFPSSNALVKHHNNNNKVCYNYNTFTRSDNHYTKNCLSFSSLLLPQSSLYLSSSSNKDIKNINENSNNEVALVENVDYLITDSDFIKESSLRPSFFKSIKNPRDILALIVVFNGVLISYFNIIGRYDITYIQIEQYAILLGIVSSIAYMIQIVSGYGISKNIRRGVVDEGVINLYSSMYTFAVSWLAYRTSELCPNWLWQLDYILPWICSFIFLYSFIAPLVTLIPSNNKIGNTICTFIVNMARNIQSNNKINDDNNTAITLPALSETELLRARGLLFIGILGSIFLPDALSFGLGRQIWWERVYQLHPSQRLLESSTSLFALFATEASMIAHRMAKYGVATFRTIVPTFGTVCLLLAIVPCICSLHWLGDDISFFSFYRE